MNPPPAKKTNKWVLRKKKVNLPRSTNPVKPVNLLLNEETITGKSNLTTFKIGTRVAIR